MDGSKPGYGRTRLAASAAFAGKIRDTPSEDAIEAVSSIADEECAVLLGRIARSGSVLADAALISLENADHVRAAAIDCGRDLARA